MHLVRDADALSTEQQYVIWAEAEVVQRRRSLRTEQYNSSWPAGVKFCPSGVARNVGRFAVIHCCAPDSLVREGESTGLNDVHWDPHTGPETKSRPKVLRNVRLKKREQHSKRSSHGMSRGVGRIAEGGLRTAIRNSSEGFVAAPALLFRLALPERLAGSKAGLLRFSGVIRRVAVLAAPNDG